MTTTPVTELIALCIDCSDASRLARFYADLTGGEVTGEYPEYGYASADVAGTPVNFQSVEGYTRPEWPGQERPQQFHLDFRVPDLEAATQHALSLGGSVARDPGGDATWRIMLDPEGHPFCLCPPRD